MTRPTLRIWLHRLCCAWATLVSLFLLMALQLGGGTADEWAAAAPLVGVLLLAIPATVLLGRRKRAGWWLSYLLGAYGFVAFIFYLPFTAIVGGMNNFLSSSFTIVHAMWLALVAAAILARSMWRWRYEAPADAPVAA